MEVSDIFAHLRPRLATVTYESPRVGGRQNRLSDDDLRKEMLFCIFGWRDDIEDLIADECKYFPFRFRALRLRGCGLSCFL